MKNGRRQLKEGVREKLHRTKTFRRKRDEKKKRQKENTKMDVEN